MTESQLKKIIREELLKSGLFEDKNLDFKKVGQFDKPDIKETPLAKNLAQAYRELFETLSSYEEILNMAGRKDSVQKATNLKANLEKAVAELQNDLNSEEYKKLSKYQQKTQAPTASTEELEPTTTAPEVRKNPSKFTGIVEP